jgi:hypothetical protein
VCGGDAEIGLVGLRLCCTCADAEVGVDRAVLRDRLRAATAAGDRAEVDHCARILIAVLRFRQRPKRPRKGAS